MTENATGADNQQGSRSAISWIDPSETTRRAPSVVNAYLLGALHDGTYNRQHRTFRFSQKGEAWLRVLQALFIELGIKSWLYREGASRGVFALETTASFLDTRFDPYSLPTEAEKIAYIRGFFDAEGGLPKSKDTRLYIQFVQKNYPKLYWIRQELVRININCGVIHCPSVKIDPDYFRFYVLTNAHKRFIEAIGSWHPRKQQLLLARMMI